MKQILLTLFSILAFSAHAVNLRDANSPVEIKSNGCLGVATGTVTYALNNDLTGTTSSVIDLGSYQSVFITLTGTAGTGAAFVDVMWSNTPTAATFNSMYTLSGPLSECLEKKGRYVKFRTSSIQPTQRVSLFYDPVNSTIVSGEVTCAACATSANQTTQITAAQGAAGSLTFVAASLIVASPNALSFGARTVGWVPLTQTAFTGLTTNANSTFGITATAGSSAYTAYRVRVSAETGVVSLRFTQHNGATVSTGFGASNGHQLLPNDRPQWLGPYTIVGSVPYFTLRASALSGATSGSAWIEIEGQP